MYTIISLCVIIGGLSLMTKKRRKRLVLKKHAPVMAVPAGTFIPSLTLKDQEELDIPTFIRRRREDKARRAEAARKGQAKRRAAKNAKGSNAATDFHQAAIPTPEAELVVPQNF